MQPKLPSKKTPPNGQEIVDGIRASLKQLVGVPFQIDSSFEVVSFSLSSSNAWEMNLRTNSGSKLTLSWKPKPTSCGSTQ